MKAILLLWIGFFQSQTMGIDHFDTVAECEAAAAALKAHNAQLEAQCLPYEVDRRLTITVPQSK